jgi:hypothetical protein
MYKLIRMMLLALVTAASTEVCAIPEIKIGSYTAERSAGETKFGEPVVTVEDNGVVITNQYNLSYSTIAADGTTPGTESTDSRGVIIVTDAATGTHVEKYYGDVIIGTAGKVYIKVTATPKASGETLTATYEIDINSLSAEQKFVPSYPSALVPGHDGLITLTTKKLDNGYGQYYLSEAKVLLSDYVINTTVNGVVTDITDHYDVNISYSGSDKLTYSNGVVKYAGIGNQWSVKSDEDLAADITALGTPEGTLAYTFTPKSEYAGYYPEITKTVDVRLLCSTSDTKTTLHLSLSREQILQESVTYGSVDGDTIHVYKYGTSDCKSGDHYQYFTPIPSLITSDGSQLQVLVGSRTSGGWGDFKLYYEIVKDSTYYDDCRYSPIAKNTGDIQAAGEATGLRITDYSYQVGKPGLVKVAVYAVLDGTPDDNGYGATLKQLYKPLTDKSGSPVTVGGYYTAYSEPIYFYIDVMKRQPHLKFVPDPNDIIFVKGDKINIPSRFDVSAYIDDSHNGEAAELIWGGEEGNDHFAYSFFISDRNSDYILLHDWPYENGQENWEANGGDIYSYKYRHIVLENYGDIDGVADIRVGDSIKVGDTFVVVTADNIEELKEKHPKIQVGDYEMGIVYNSMKGYGNESWTIEFLQTGQYNIPYTVRPWNHTRWDNSTEIGVTFRYTEDEFINTKIDLGYYFQVADKGQASFDEPTAKVVVPVYNNYDVTRYFDFEYSIYSDVNRTGTTIDPTTGEVTIGSDATGDVVVKVKATRNDQTINYKNPDETYYTIRIVDGAARAKWEVISTCKVNGCEEHATKPRFDASHMAEANGRMHFLTSGLIYGGTVIEGVPGISMTIGVPATSAEAAADWTTVATAEATPKCCAHETNSVIVKSNIVLDLDEDGIPSAGAFYQFNPTVNGYLTIDAKFWKNNTIVLISRDANGVCTDEVFCNTGNTSIVYPKATYDADGNLLGDYTFTKPLIAGETYYLYDVTEGGNLNLHGFSYQPAFIFDRNTTQAESETPLTASAFMNGLSSEVPTLYDNDNANVSFAVSDAYGIGVNAKDYVTVGSNGALDPQKMTLIGDNIFKLRVTATVESTDASLGDCVNKTPYYDLQIIDIPTFAIASSLDDYNDQNIQAGTQVTTTNISTDIIMTFSGWTDSDNKYNASAKTDTWSYKSAAGAASRIGSELPDNDPTYNRTIDGFDYFNAGAQNPVDEKNMSALQPSTMTLSNGNNYTYGSGTEYEQSTEVYYNTTYKLPCRGAFLKFEPRESGTLIVYLVQNGSCDYHYGVAASKAYKMKWRPLYITDETGKPVTMVNSFGNISKYLPTGDDENHAGSFTLGISRCSKQENAIERVWDYSSPDVDKEDGCSFDWSEFRGTEEDRQHLLAAWPAKGERESIIRLANGGFALPHKAYVRYSFHVSAGKTYFVFQPGSKPEFGGFSFVPAGFPNNCKYAITSKPGALVYNATNQEKNYAGTTGADDLTFTWENPANFTSTLENRNITINDRRKSELTSASDKDELKPRSFTAGKWEGICLPFSVSTQEAERVFGEGYALVTCDGVTDGGVLHFVRHANTYIEAGRPYIIKPTKAGTFSFKNVTIEGAETVEKLNGTTTGVVDPSRFDVDVNDGEYTFKGTYMRETMPAMSYFAKEDGLYCYSKDAKIGGYRSYFKLNNASVGAGAKAMSFYVEDLFDGEYEDDEVATGIILVNAEGDITEMPKDAAMYNLSGQKVSSSSLGLNNAPSGVYIINGRKIVK